MLPRPRLKKEIKMVGVTFYDGRPDLTKTFYLRQNVPGYLQFPPGNRDQPAT